MTEIDQPAGHGALEAGAEPGVGSPLAREMERVRADAEARTPNPFVLVGYGNDFVLPVNGQTPRSSTPKA